MALLPGSGSARLIVGGIGIMNVLLIPGFASRTEIGIRRAVPTVGIVGSTLDTADPLGGMPVHRLATGLTAARQPSRRARPDPCHRAA